MDVFIQNFHNLINIIPQSKTSQAHGAGHSVQPAIDDDSVMESENSEDLPRLVINLSPPATDDDSNEGSERSEDLPRLVIDVNI